MKLRITSCGRKVLVVAVDGDRESQLAAVKADVHFSMNQVPAAEVELLGIDLAANEVDGRLFVNLMDKRYELVDPERNPFSTLSDDELACLVEESGDLYLPPDRELSLQSEWDRRKLKR